MAVANPNNPGTTFMRSSYPTETWTMRRRRATPEIDQTSPPHPEGWHRYDFRDQFPDIRSLVLTIGTLGKDLVGVELGLYRAESFCTLLQCCPNIKTLYGVDSWVAYDDYIGTDGTRAGKKTTIPEMDLVRETALNFVYFSGEAHRAEILEMDTSEAVQQFEDDSLDFVFLDAYLSIEQAQRELNEWWPKVKKGGLFSGHDWNDKGIRQTVRNFIKENDPDATWCAYDATWAWIK